MSNGPSFEAFLGSKRIDSEAFRNGEPEVWEAWKREFEQMHPISFTVQKLNLINPVRRKYLLQIRPEPGPGDSPPQAPPRQPPSKPARPVIRPKTD